MYTYVSYTRKVVYTQDDVKCLNMVWLITIYSSRPITNWSIRVKALVD